LQIGLAQPARLGREQRALKRFPSNLREIIKADVTPFYRLELTPKTNLGDRPEPKKYIPIALVSLIRIPDWQDEGCEIARAQGLGFTIALQTNGWHLPMKKPTNGNAQNAGRLLSPIVRTPGKLR